jgi:hypothetical protein
MSNYPNMSYCMTQNTLLALQQVLDAMREEGPQFLRELPRDERRAFEELFDACEEFVMLAEEIEEDQASDSEYDGQPDEAQEWHDFDPDC